MVKTAPASTGSTYNATTFAQAITGLSFQRRSIARLFTKATEIPSAISAKNETDSGYASISTTSDLEKKSPYVAQERVTVISRKLFQRKITKLRVFSKEIPESAQNRFIDLMEVYQRPLYDSLSKSRANFGDVSLKLKFLGETEANAKLWIVVQCDKTIFKRVKQFFNQKHVRNDYQPCDGSDLPFFEIIVYEHPPRRTADGNHPLVYSCVQDNTAKLQTLCGTLIKVGEDHKTRTATIGGVIRVEYSSGNKCLYAMTAGHLNSQGGKVCGLEGKETSNGDVEAEGLEEGSLSDDEVFELNGNFDEECSTMGCVNTPDIRPWSKIGYVSIPPIRNSGEQRNMDWALVTLQDPMDYRPNLIVGPNANQYPTNSQLKEYSGEESHIRSGRNIIILSGTGHKSGKLLTRSSFLMLAPGKKFVGTYDVTLTNGSRLCAGDSGSWVVDALNYEVFGHVVASDIFGEALVIPIKATLQDIKERFAADEVGLPTDFNPDISILHSKVGQHDDSGVAGPRSTSDELAPVPPVNIKLGSMAKIAKANTHSSKQADLPELNHDITGLAASEANLSDVRSHSPVSQKIQVPISSDASPKHKTQSRNKHISSVSRSPENKSVLRTLFGNRKFEGIKRPLNRLSTADSKESPMPVQPTTLPPNPENDFTADGRGSRALNPELLRLDSARHYQQLMDPLTLAAAVAGLIGTSFALGTRLYSLYDQYCAASKEFEAFGREVKAFGGTWQMVQPCLEHARPLLSLDCLQTLTNICNGTNDILEDVTETIDIFAFEDKRAPKRATQGTTPVFLRFRNKPATDDRAHRIRKFFKRNDFTLQRSQLLYANITLQLVLTVINYARTVPNSGVANQVLDNSDLIIIEQNRARNEIRRRERQEKRDRRGQVLRVEAIQWLDRLPPPEISSPGEGRKSPLEQLANRWVIPECRPGSFVLDDHSDVTSSEDRRTPYGAIVDELRIRNRAQAQEMQTQAQQIQHLNQQMQQLRQDLRNVVEELRNTTADSARYRRERNDALADRDRVLHELRQMEDARNQYHKESHYLRKENDLLIDKLENIDIKNHPATISCKDNDEERRPKRMSRYREARGPPPTSQRGFPRPPEHGESSDRSSNTLC